MTRKEQLEEKAQQISKKWGNIPTLALYEMGLWAENSSIIREPKLYENIKLKEKLTLAKKFLEKCGNHSNNLLEIEKIDE